MKEYMLVLGILREDRQRSKHTIIGLIAHVGELYEPA